MGEYFHPVAFVHVFGAVKPKDLRCEPLDLKIDGLFLLSRRILAEELGFLALGKQSDAVDFLQCSGQPLAKRSVYVVAGAEESSEDLEIYP
jgi:hypothetical protein